MESSAQLVLNFPSQVVVFGDDNLPSERHPDILREPQEYKNELDLALQLEDSSGFLQEPHRLHVHALDVSSFQASDVTHSDQSRENTDIQRNLNVFVTAADGDSGSVDDTSARDVQNHASATDACSPTGVKAAVRRNVSHTRRCRAKVNSNFERLLEVLPEPPLGVEIKHKAQILQRAIDYYRHVSCRNRQLEMQLALRSPSAIHRWVESVIRKAPVLKDALKSFMAMICLTNNWKYAELWSPQTRRGSSCILLKYVTGAVPPTVEGNTLHRLRTYRDFSRKYNFAPRCGVPGRVFLTMRPEWLAVLSDPVAFLRAPHAMRNGVEVTFAVPIIVNGSVQMVVEFFDTDRRDYDPKTLNMANEIGAVFGKAFSEMQAPCSFF
ncbi:unnamed protein product [Agarophyton chilense]|eukprot:gb/GEZJ01003031.1/.p1 GENE.gb/GEZJ01003031.1/~~gb/GEZJ01003031.1/.p1  ORF type:complete len:381 (-),score=44.25 gb/GEZJ01003031.1/:366-1508(-)